MDPARTDLNKLGKKTPYLLLSLIFIILSAVVLYLFYFSKQLDTNPQLITPPTDDFYPLIPTASPVAISPSPTDDTSPPAPLPLEPTAGIKVNTVPPSPIPTVIPDYQTFTDDADAFTVEYSSSRTLYQDKNVSANRYTFYSASGSIAVHVGPDWSWQHPGRQFTPIFKVSGQDTFRYDINRQTIVDIDMNNLKYTIQCVHNAKPELISECDQFFSTFRLL